MVQAAKWSAVTTLRAALAHHDIFPLGESCADGDRGFGRGMLALPKYFRTPSRDWLEAVRARTLRLRHCPIEETELAFAKAYWRHAYDLVGQDLKGGAAISGTSSAVVKKLHEAGP